MNCDSYSIRDTTISFIDEMERGPKKDWLKHKFRHYGYFHRIMNMLAAEGFNVQQDPDVDKIIRCDYWIGKRGIWNLMLKNIQMDSRFSFSKTWYMKTNTAAGTILTNWRKCHI